VTMPNEYQWAPQFAEQTLLRTVTLGWQPYLPFSQQMYRMTPKSDTTNPRRGVGYFQYLPTKGSQFSGEAEGTNYPWKVRADVYRGMGTEGLQHMSQYHNRWGMAQEAANRLPGRSAATARFGQRFQRMVGGKDLAQEQGLMNQGNKLPSRVQSELAVGAMSRRIEGAMRQEGATIAQKNVNRGVQKGAGFSSANFDLQLENMGALTTMLNQTFSKEIMKNVQSLEMTQSRGKKVKDKVLSMNEKDMSTAKGDSESAKFKGHFNNILEGWNKEIRRFVEGMSPEELDASKYKQVLDKTGNIHAATRALLPTAKSAAEYGATEGGSQVQTWSAIRQFIDRAHRNSRIDSQMKLAVGKSQHIYQANLPNAKIGLAVVGTKTPIPKYKGTAYTQFAPVKEVAIMAGGDSGTLMEAMGMWAMENDYIDSAELESMMEKAVSLGANQAIMTMDRAARIGQSAEIGATVSAEGNISLEVGGIGSTVRLTSSSIAQNLSDQVYNFYNNKGRGSRQFENWFKGLMAEANKLTRAWYDRMPFGLEQRMSEEFVFGDNMGNPHKHFMGIWNERNKPAWEGDTGTGISMAPFMVARRAAVAAFRTGGLGV